MFAYTKNNPINRKDDHGFLSSSVFGEGGGEPYESKSSTASTNSSSSFINKFVNKVSNAVGGGVRSVIGAGLDASIAAKIFYPKTFSKALNSGYGLNYAAVKTLKYTGPLGVAAGGGFSKYAFFSKPK